MSSSAPDCFLGGQYFSLHMVWYSNVLNMFCSGGGIWQPDAGPLSLLRRAVDRKPHKLKRVLTAAAMRKEFFEGIPNDEERAVKAFVKHNQENMLKTKPKVGSQVKFFSPDGLTLFHGLFLPARLSVD